MWHPRLVATHSEMVTLSATKCHNQGRKWECGWYRPLRRSDCSNNPGEYTRMCLPGWKRCRQHWASSCAHCSRSASQHPLLHLGNCQLYALLRTAVSINTPPRGRPVSVIQMGISFLTAWTMFWTLVKFCQNTLYPSFTEAFWK